MKRDIDTILEALPYLVKPGYCDHSRSVATHEASHAVIILLNSNGQAPERVTLDPPMTYFRWDKLPAEIAAMVHMAGAAGQALHSGRYVFSEGDRENLYNTVSTHRMEYPIILSLWKHTHADLINNWPMVQLIASALMREGTLKENYFKRFLKKIIQ
ncbi:MAG: hypothetical protein RQ743_13975 [Bacteroidales bacterium]|nr:hypothetical protein [Bacteroidales bacterium]MDT8402791.1 hypothetical protein [Bacteroidales bacterium]